MNTRSFPHAPVAFCAFTETFRHSAVRLVLAASLAVGLSAQPSIVDTPQQVSGPVLFDDAGNSYNWSFGPITDGVVQTQNGGGTCISSGGFFTIFRSCSDAYIAKADPAGNLVFGTYLGGSTADLATALTVDSDGNVLVAGTTQGSFPVTLTTSVTEPHTFAAKLNPNGTQLLYATYLPEASTTVAAMTTDLQGSVYIAGATTNAGYALMLNAGGSPIYNVPLPGRATALTRDGQGNLIVAGYTGQNETADCFIVKIDASGNVLFSKTFGGSGSDTPSSVQTDFAGEIYLAGATTSLNLPTTLGVLRVRPIVPLSNWYGPGGFVAKFSPDGSIVRWSTYIPTADRSQGGVTQLVVMPTGDIYVAGRAGAGFPTTNTAPQPCFQGGVDMNNAFVARLNEFGVMQDATYVGQNSGVYGFGLSPAGDVRIAWSGGGKNTNSVLRFGTLSVAWACLSPSVQNSATLTGNDIVSPGEIISLTGLGIGPETGVGYQPDGQGRVPTQLADIQVLLNGRPIPILYAQSRQINAIVPMDLPFRIAGDVVKMSLSVLRQGSAVGTFDVFVSFGIPGVFRLEPGFSTRAAAVNQDGTVNSPDHPAPRGSIVSFWGTGFGPGNPACTAGDLNLPRPTGPLPNMSAYFFTGGQASATYIGGAPGLLCGITQLNIRIPEDTVPGVLTFTPVSEATQGDTHTSTFGGTGATIFVQ